MGHKTNRNAALWLLSGCFLVFCMVIIGCLTRLTQSGLSITDWSFMGTLPPLSVEDWNEHFNRYQNSPEFRHINSSMTLEQFKSIFWWEWIHRFVGRLTGGIFVGGFLWLTSTGKMTLQLLLRSLLLVALGGHQGVIGWWMVQSGLVDDPYVSHFRLAIHLVMAFTIFAATFWFALENLYPTFKEKSSKSLSVMAAAFISFGAAVIQIILGAFVAGLKAGHYYPTWPKMGEEWFPAKAILVTGSMITDFTENPVGVQFLHRTFAWVFALSIVILVIVCQKNSVSRTALKAVRHCAALTLVQILLGIATLLYSVPIVLGALHQATAFVIFGNFIFLFFHLSREAQTSR